MTRDEIVDRLICERYEGAWWTRRAAETGPAAAVGPSVPEFTEDELEARRGRIRRAELEAALNEPTTERISG